MTGEWQTDALDLKGYLARIGEESGPASGATLERLHRAHVAAIPFENLDLVLGRGVSVDLESVEAKLVHRGRGGYCYEHAVLFAAALERLGFGVDRLLARIGHRPERPRPRTHMALHVTAPGGEWLADVGFGAGVPAPVPWDGREHPQDGWEYRLVTDRTGTRQLQERGTGKAGEWSALHSFTDEPQHASDVEMANHYTATHPGSPFLGRVVVMQRADHRRTRLLGRTLETSRPDGSKDERELADGELPGVLGGLFGIPLSEAELSALAARLPPG
ncbi:arylamine N-acetyltransferase [Streptomyces sp. HNM0575]|uniref:arylamine N-acetyltransferase family protein n=1 Tax=Streptomyces sp. HNM0575 TaxID=2716338 RepID=UPI00145E36EC|nr:arylamine N-acetyltransferase [Streptomyces sp. HNM0575]NLU72679.1 arylamine N-acetyltransferase [Streptomyces sp. HNM0575]